MDIIDGLHKSSVCGGVLRTDTVLEWAKGKWIRRKHLKFCCQEKSNGQTGGEKSYRTVFFPSGQDWIEHICVFVFCWK